jgi:hypothetical protein
MGVGGEDILFTLTLTLKIKLLRIKHDTLLFRAYFYNVRLRKWYHKNVKFFHRFCSKRKSYPVSERAHPLSGLSGI